MQSQTTDGGEIEARQATLLDVEWLIDLCRDGFPGTLLWDGPRFRWRKWWQSVLRSASAETWLFSLDHEPSGACVLVLDMKKWQAEIQGAERSWAVRLCAAALCPKLVVSRLVKRVLGNRSPTSACPKSEPVVGATGSHTRIRLLAVASYKRRQGVGRTILRFCERRTLELGRDTINLVVSAENASARRLYAQQGYVCTAHGDDRCVFTKIPGS